MVPVAVVAGAAGREVEPVLAAAGLAGSFTAIVSSDDVVHGKPHPEGYLRALELLGGVAPGEAVALEDTGGGGAPGETAGARCPARPRPPDPPRPGAPGRIAPARARQLLRRPLGAAV